MSASENTSGAANAPDAVADTERDATAQAPAPRAWHVMLDLEALSTAKDAAVFQIAALCFDPETGETGPSFCTFFRPSQVRGHIDVSTIAWWMVQKACADVADRWTRSTEQWPLKSFRDWLDSLKVVALWSHGATFDLVVLENQYRALGQDKPWSYRVERDTRTLYALAYEDGKAPPPWDVNKNRQHDAAYDCEVQAQQVTMAWRKVTGAAIADDSAGLPDSVIETIHAAALDTLA